MSPPRQGAHLFTCFSISSRALVSKDLPVEGLEASASELKAAIYGLNWDKTLSSIDLEVRRWLLLFDLLLQHVQQVNRVGRDLVRIEVEHLGQDLEGEAG